MGRNIILCLDGTNNEYSATNTNVVKIHALLRRDSAEQITYYQPGIGTMPPPGYYSKAKEIILKQLDLAIAFLLRDHVLDAYRFLMNAYEEGDNIYLFGFSRGSYTARVLAAMVRKVGLIGRENEELIPFAWDIYTRKYSNAGTVIAQGFRQTFSRDIRIKFLGLWDTVSSVGWTYNPKHYEFTANNPSVEIVRHAVSLDERRAYFPQNLWTHTPPESQDVDEVWFPGVHCDIGGGYLESEAGLSKIPLRWLVSEAIEKGLLVDPVAMARVIPQMTTDEYSAPDPCAMMHNSLKGLWWILEFLPKRVRDPKHGFSKKFIFHEGHPRVVEDGAKLHISIFERMSRLVEYKPRNIPSNYIEVK